MLPQEILKFSFSKRQFCVFSERFNERMNRKFRARGATLKVGGGGGGEGG